MDCGCEVDVSLPEVREDKLEGTRTKILGEAGETRGHKSNPHCRYENWCRESDSGRT